ncbi:DpnII family type II restriction endonuclease [Mycoplasmopsis pullorum]|uniref:Type-2 restriction enzyme n=1 Tax=Mycoplasmopsis pullorum TaxID=48003 RepID=A0A1L4FR82_9BACT|nr:DpnII family type II restriction endonuclease [Mycoplasmopsis pullorum]APJ38112.1 hypothetical protein BLA55_00165 [Mycoplasmopsis pullorum]APJ38774.1 hypothetical protein BLA55_03895 [Mycoplasmopsis pullorum]
MKKNQINEKLFVKTLLTKNKKYDYFVNWDNVTSQIENSIEINAMNSLIKCNDFKNKFFELLEKVPTVITVFPLLIAISKDSRKRIKLGNSNLEVLNEDGFVEEFDFSIKKAKKGINEKEKEIYYRFFEKIGLKKLFQEIIEKSVYDYITGVLVGLDSNGRKNRSGLVFEEMCKEIIESICKDYDINLLVQNKFKNLENFNIRINNNISGKKPDFILYKGNTFLNIEVNFYGSAGSKPQETIDSYINRKQELNNNNIEFILITDGYFWQTVQENLLEKAFNNILLMNYQTAKSGELRKQIKEIFNLK